MTRAKVFSAGVKIILFTLYLWGIVYFGGQALENKIKAESNKLSDQQQMISAAYVRGYKEGKAEAMESLPKACVSWWFQGQNLAERKTQIQAAYCKGNHGPKKTR